MSHDFMKVYVSVQVERAQFPANQGNPGLTKDRLRAFNHWLEQLLHHFLIAQKVVVSSIALAVNTGAIKEVCSENVTRFNHYWRTPVNTGSNDEKMYFDIII
jgi:hypothetical protein